MEDIKICVKCKWHRYTEEHETPWEYQKHLCFYPRGDIDLVTGERTQTVPRLCRYARATIDGDCGPEGNYWEPINDIHTEKED